MKNAVSKKRSPKPAPQPSPPPVRFEFEDPGAQSVCVAGSFNEWNPTATPMGQSSAGQWLKELALPPGSYEYLLVVDGQWRVDPRCSRQVPNVYGGMNCVVEVVAPS